MNKAEKITKHRVADMFTDNELSEESTIRDFRIVQYEGLRKVSRNVKRFFGLAV